LLVERTPIFKKQILLDSKKIQTPIFTRPKVTKINMHSLGSESGKKEKPKKENPNPQFKFLACIQLIICNPFKKLFDICVS